MRIEFTRAAEKALDRVEPKRRRLILDRIRLLADNPQSPLLDVRTLQGREDVSRLRVGNYRVLFRTDAGEDVIRIEMIRTRGDVYKR